VLTKSLSATFFQIAVDYDCRIERNVL